MSNEEELGSEEEFYLNESEKVHLNKAEETLKESGVPYRKVIAYSYHVMPNGEKKRYKYYRIITGKKRSGRRKEISDEVKELRAEISRSVRTLKSDEIALQKILEYIKSLK